MTTFNNLNVGFRFLFLILLLSGLYLFVGDVFAATLNSTTVPPEGDDKEMWTTYGTYFQMRQDAMSKRPSAEHDEIFKINFADSVDSYITTKACCLWDNVSGARAVFSKDEEMVITMEDINCHNKYPRWNNRNYRPDKQAQEIAEWNAWMGRLAFHEHHHHLSFVAFLDEENLKLSVDQHDFSKGSESICTQSNQVDAAKVAVVRQLQAELVNLQSTINGARLDDVNSDHGAIGSETEVPPAIP